MRVKRWLVRGMLVLAGVPLVAGGLAWAWLRGGLPVERGTLTVAGLVQPVTIVRDRHAVPHIFAQTQDDAYFALGFVHAQDRLWQMDMTRRLGAGRLAEVLGPAVLRYDRMNRVLGLYRRAEGSYQAMAPEIRAAFDAYAAGVNAWLLQHNGPLPIEFQLLRYRPEPWRPADSLVWSKLMALQLSSNYREELLRLRLARQVPPDQVERLLPRSGTDDPVTLAAALGRLTAAGIDLAAIDADRLLGQLPVLGPDRASNEWVLAGRRTDTGLPILVNDPHLQLDAPILWYLARIQAPGLNLAGATVPGVPFHLLGHNDRIAWGLTTTGSDTEDLFIERPDSRDPGRYLVPGGSEPFQTRQETIAVRGQAAETLTVRETRHGPVLSDVDAGTASAGRQRGDVVALAFTGLGEADTSAAAIYHLNRARDWPDFLAALRLYQSPQQNFVYADVDGHIGFIAPGLVPVRRAGDGTLPVPGWTGEADWTGAIPFADLPQALDPPSGQFVNANNAIVGPSYRPFLTARWAEASRARRIEQVLDRSDRHSVASAEDLLQDTVSLPARSLLPELLALAGDDESTAPIRARLRAWDGRMQRDRAEPLIFEAWLRELNRELFAARLGGLFEQYWAPNATAVAGELADGCRPAGCAGAVRRSLIAALDWIGRRWGNDANRWRWGEAHRAPLAHQLLSRLPGLNRLFDISIDTDGGFYTVNRGASDYGDDAAPFADRHGAGYRAVYDLANLDNSQFMIATGQSGNPLSFHYDDLVQRWRDGGHFALAGTAQQLQQAGGNSLLLRPQSGPPHANGALQK